MPPERRPQKRGLGLAGICNGDILRPAAGTLIDRNPRPSDHGTRALDRKAQALQQLSSWELFIVHSARLVVVTIYDAVSGTTILGTCE